MLAFVLLAYRDYHEKLSAAVSHKIMPVLYWLFLFYRKDMIVMKQLKIYKSTNKIVFKISSDKLKMDKYFDYEFDNKLIRFFRLHKTDHYHDDLISKYNYKELNKFEILFDEHQKQLFKKIFTRIYIQSIYLKGDVAENIISEAYTSNKCLVPLSKEFCKLILEEFPELELQKFINK